MFYICINKNKQLLKIKIMKNLKDYQIIILIAAFFISALTLTATLTRKPTPEKENKTFVGVDAAGFKQGAGTKATIINH